MKFEDIKLFLQKDHTIVTSAPNNGTTSCVLYFADKLSVSESVLFYNPTNTLNRTFVMDNYPVMFENTVILSCDFEHFVQYITENNSLYDFIIIDPGDILAGRVNICLLLSSILKNTKMIITSQIRADIASGGVYSTLEKSDKNRVFKNSIWLRNVTEKNDFFNRKYIDIYNGARSGNNYEYRGILNFKKDGSIHEEN